MTIATKPKRKAGKQVVFTPAHNPVSTQQERPIPATKIWWSIILAVFLLAGIWLFWMMGQPVWELLALIGDQEAVSAYLQGFGAWGPVVLVLVQIIQVLAAVVPGHVFLVAAGYVYGLPYGFLLNYLSVVAASQFAFCLARWAGRPLVNRLVPDQALEKWYAMGEKQGFLFFTIAFLLPVFPTDVMNFVAGLSGISPRKFLAANFLGRLPGALLLTLIGSHGLQFSHTIWAVILLVSAATYVIGRLAINRMERQLHLPTS